MKALIVCILIVLWPHPCRNVYHASAPIDWKVYHVKQLVDRQLREYRESH